MMSVGWIIGVSILNLFFALVLSPLLEGSARKLRAMVHSRIGPPILQPYYDLAKLLGKEDLRSSPNPLTRIAPLGCLVSVGLAALLAPMGTFEPPLGAYGDTILFISCFALT